MKRIGKTAAVLTAGGALALGGIAVAVPALAGAGGPGGRPAAQGQTLASHGPGAGIGMAQGPGYGPGDGTCHTPPAPAGSLTAAQKTTLAQAAEQEKLAHDLYAAFASRYDARVFDRIGTAETSHLAAIRTLLDRYGVTHPTVGKAAGTFTTVATKATYDRLLAEGKVSEQAALRVGVTAEKAQIAMLQKAKRGVTAKDVTQVYDRLLTTSQRHLAAFEASAN